MNDADSGASPDPVSATSSLRASTAPPAVGDRRDPFEDDSPIPPGRPVRLEPTPPGFRRVLLGAVVAVLSPLFGILVGTSVGSLDTTSAMDPLYWGFFLGGLIGALGLVSVGFGAASLLRYSRRGEPA